MSTASRDRGCRAAHLILAVISAAGLAAAVLALDVPLIASLAFAFLVNTACFLADWRRIASARTALMVPDYARIAVLEREIFGEAFHHDGAPGIAPSPAPAYRSRSAGQLTPIAQVMSGYSPKDNCRDAVEVFVQERADPVARIARKHFGLCADPGCAAAIAGTEHAHGYRDSDLEAFRREVAAIDARMALTAGIPPAQIGSEEMARWIGRARKAGYISREGAES
jgi:hypothetical protein